MTQVQTKSNVIKFNKDVSTLRKVADTRSENSDLEGTLPIEFDIAKVGRCQASAYAKIANTYSALMMYNESIKYWFKYLDCVSKRHYAVAYNGLGGNFYLLGYNDVATYYFNLQINNENPDDDFEMPYDEYLYELFYLASDSSPKIKLVDNQGKKDAESIEKSKRIFEKNPSAAFALIETVQKDSSKYAEAVVTSAAFEVVNGNYENARKKYISILKDENWGSYAYNNLFGCLFLMERYDEADGIYKEMIKQDIADYGQLAKFFHVFDREKDKEKAYKFSKYLLMFFDNPDSAFLAGCSAYNIGKFEEAHQYFSRYYRATQAYFALYYTKLCEKAIKGKDKNIDKEIEYMFSLPVSFRKKLEKDSINFMSMTDGQLKRHSSEVFEFCDGCFAINNIRLQGIACEILTFVGTLKSEKYLKNILIDPMVDDKIKILVVTLLVKNGNDKLTGMVYGNVYSRIQFEKVEFSEQNGDTFIDAYAMAFGRLAPYDEDQLYKLKIAAYEIYYKLVANGNVRKVSNVVALAGLIVISSNIKLNKTNEEIAEFMSTTQEDIDKIILLVEKD